MKYEDIDLQEEQDIGEDLMFEEIATCSKCSNTFKAKVALDQLSSSVVVYLPCVCGEAVELVIN